MVEKVVTQTFFTGYSTAGIFKPDTKITDIQLVKRDLLNHFLTRKGERVMRPNYGTIIYDMLFEPFTEIIRDSIISDVERIISSEPRVQLNNVDALEFEHGLRIDISLLFLPFDVLDTFSVNFDRRNNINNTISAI